jgi:endoglucanase
MVCPNKLLTGLLFLIGLDSPTLYAQSPCPNIRLNQAGFYPNAPKIAVIVDSDSSKDFWVVSADKKNVVFRSGLSKIRQSNNSPIKTRIGDFSQLHTRGEFLVFVPGLGYSYRFKIAPLVHRPLATAALKGFYFQRASMPLEKKYAGIWEHAAGHPDTAVLIHASAASIPRPEGTVLASPGGWYDAGDYNKYMVNSGISVGTLLAAYEDFPLYFGELNTNIPESGDKIPDILNEVLYNLRWMLTMQDPNDGGVYHKCTNAAFDGMVMPGVTRLPRYLVQKGTAATLDFSAVMAQASRVFDKFRILLPGLSDSCIKASVRAWQWAQKNPSLEYNQEAMNMLFKPKITTGAYGDKNFADEWFWAAAELLVATKDELYFQMVREKMNDPISLPSWSNVFMLGNYTLLRFEKQLSAGHAKEIQQIKGRLLEFADSYLSTVEDNAFQTVMGQSRKDFIWGSNSNAANQGILLINAYFISKNKKYVDNALTNLDYLMGRNATGYCFITGMGSNSPRHPHHRPSVADGIDDPVPGLMAGGPNPGRQDGCAYIFFDPETAYLDSSCAYASNEIAINWNAPLVYLSCAIEALQFQLKYSKSQSKE